MKSFHPYSFVTKTLAVFIISFFYIQPIWSDSSVSLDLGENGGIQLFETGNKYPNLSGLQGGSRITYKRRFPYMGLSFNKYWGKWGLSAGFKTTGWTQPTSNGKDEDFFLGTISKEQGTKIDLWKLSFHDTPYVFTGSRDFAIANADQTIFHYSFDLSLKHYYGSADSDPRKEGRGAFLSAGLHYNYSKSKLYNAVQFLATNPIYLAPIGDGSSFTQSTFVIPFGVGYRLSTTMFVYDFEFAGGIANTHFRDYHVQRDLNFIGDNSAYFVKVTAGAGYKFSEDYMLYATFVEERIYGSGTFRTKGGLSLYDLSSNGLGNFGQYLNTKQFSFQLSLTKFLSSI